MSEDEDEFFIGQIFEEEYSPFAAVWCNENNAYIEEIAKADGKRRFQIKAIPEPSLDELKSAKLIDLESEFLDYRASKTTFVNSSLGFKANANSTAYMDVDGLIGILEAQKASGTVDPTVTFMDFENSPHSLTVENLKTLKNEISANGTRAYSVKWQLRDKINAAKSSDDLNAIVIDFSPE